MHSRASASSTTGLMKTTKIDAYFKTAAPSRPCLQDADQAVSAAMPHVRGATCNPGPSAALALPIALAPPLGRQHVAMPAAHNTHFQDLLGGPGANSALHGLPMVAQSGSTGRPCSETGSHQKATASAIYTANRWDEDEEADIPLEKTEWGAALSVYPTEPADTEPGFLHDCSAPADSGPYASHVVPAPVTSCLLRRITGPLQALATELRPREDLQRTIEVLPKVSIQLPLSADARPSSSFPPISCAAPSSPDQALCGPPVLSGRTMGTASACVYAHHVSLADHEMPPSPPNSMPSSTTTSGQTVQPRAILAARYDSAAADQHVSLAPLWESPMSPYDEPRARAPEDAPAYPPPQAAPTPIHMAVAPVCALTYPHAQQNVPAEGSTPSPPSSHGCTASSGGSVWAVKAQAVDSGAQSEATERAKKRQPLLEARGTTRAKRPRASSSEVSAPSDPPASVPANAGVLSFFERTAAACANAAARAAQDGSSARETCAAVVDPWSFGGSATQHVNAPRPTAGAVGSRPWGNPDRGDSAERSCWIPDLCDLTSQRRPYVEPAETSEPKLGTEPWCEKYRDSELEGVQDLNRSSVAALQEWLGGFYGCDHARRDSESVSMSSEYAPSQDSCASFSNGLDGEYGDAVNVALLCGPAGVGKTTIIRRAAKNLGLSILEINAGTFRRTGKAIKDAFSGALTSHRVTISAPGASSGVAAPTHVQNGGSNSLTVFEEVDELFTDERGFWSTIVDLSRMSGRRRPIVLTANRLSADMRRVFGDCVMSPGGEVSHLLDASINPATQASFSRILYLPVDPPSTRALHLALRAIASAEMVALAKLDVRILSGMFAGGDVRGAINALQFWATGVLASDRSTMANSFMGSCTLFDAGEWSARALQRAQDSLWEGCNDSRRSTAFSLAAAHCRAVSNATCVRMQADDQHEDEPAAAESALSDWACHLDNIAFADSVKAAHAQRTVDADPHVLGGEHVGSADTVLLAEACARSASAVESESMVVFGRNVNAKLPVNGIANDSGTLGMLHSTFALMWPTGHSAPDSLAAHSAVPPTRAAATDVHPVLRCIAKDDLAAQHADSASHDRPPRPMRSRRRCSSKGIYCTSFLDLSEATAGTLARMHVRSPR